VADLTAAFAFQYEVTLRRKNTDELKSTLPTPSFTGKAKLTDLTENVRIVD
jgi:hypothetical protein